jgi:glutaredoxin
MVSHLNRYIIYGRSTCPFCKKAVDLLDSKHKESIFFDFSEDLEAITDAKRFYKFETVPIILENNNVSGLTKLIGGYSDLVEYLND